MKRSPAEKLSLIMELLGGKEECPTCGNITEKPQIITPEQARELLEIDESSKGEGKAG